MEVPPNAPEHADIASRLNRHRLVGPHLVLFRACFLQFFIVEATYRREFNDVNGFAQLLFKVYNRVFAFLGVRPGSLRGPPFLPFYLLVAIGAVSARFVSSWTACSAAKGTWT